VVSSAALLKDGPLIVTFYRGIWCPYCREDLKDLAAHSMLDDNRRKAVAAV
jgi:peroxiredoxin